jgi:hypothetical protein
MLLPLAFIVLTIFLAFCLAFFLPNAQEREHRAAIERHKLIYKRGLAGAPLVRKLVEFEFRGGNRPAVIQALPERHRTPNIIRQICARRCSVCAYWSAWTPLRKTQPDGHCGLLSVPCPSDNGCSSGKL